MAKEKETKQEVQKKKEEPSLLSWLNHPCDGINNELKVDKNNPLPNYFGDMLTSYVSCFINDHDFIRDMEHSDIFELNIYSSPVSDNIRVESNPYFRESTMLTTSWTSHYLGIILPMEIRNFMLFLCETEQDFNALCNLYRNAVACELFKLTILNDYLLDELPAEEAALFNTCEKVFLEDGTIYPRGFEYSTDFKVGVFMNMFFRDEEFETRSFEPTEILDRHWYEDFLYNRFMKEENGEAIWAFYSGQFGMIEHDIKAVYRMFYNVNKNTIKKLDKDVKDYHLEHSKKLMFLVELCHIIIDYWDKLREETANKFKIDAIRDVDISIVNMDFLKNFVVDSYHNNNQNMSFEDFVNGRLVYLQSSGITHFSMTSFGNAKLEVFISLSQKIDAILMDWCNLSKDEMINNIKITLRHEMGHVVNDCMIIDKNGLKVAMYVMSVSAKRRNRLMEQYRNTPPEQALHHTYWYYTFIPEERKANEVMGLTIEDMYKSDNLEIPDDIKKFLEESK